MNRPYAHPGAARNTHAADAPRWVAKRDLADLLRAVARAELGASAAAVAAALWTFTGPDGVAWPSLDTLAARACVSRRTAINAVSDLEVAGILTRAVPSPRARAVRQSTTYRLGATAPAATAAPPSPVLALDAPTPPAADESPATPLLVAAPHLDAPVDLAPVEPPAEPIASEPVAAPPSTAEARAGATVAVEAPEPVQTLHPKGSDPELKEIQTCAPPARAPARLSRAARSELNRTLWRAGAYVPPPPSPRPALARCTPASRTVEAPRARTAPPSPAERDAVLEMMRAWRAARAAAPA